MINVKNQKDIDKINEVLENNSEVQVLTNVHMYNDVISIGNIV